MIATGIGAPIGVGLIAGGVGGGAGTDLATSAGAQYVTTGHVDPTNLAIDTVIGAGAGGIGSLLPGRGGAGAPSASTATIDPPMISTTATAVPASTANTLPDTHGVMFFDQQIAGYYKVPDPPLGLPGAPTFVMPLTDFAVVRTPADAARYTGMAPRVSELG